MRQASSLSIGRWAGGGAAAAAFAVALAVSSAARANATSRDPGVAWAMHVGGATLLWKGAARAFYAPGATTSLFIGARWPSAPHPVQGLGYRTSAIVDGTGALQRHHASVALGRGRCVALLGVGASTMLAPGHDGSPWLGVSAGALAHCRPRHLPVAIAVPVVVDRVATEVGGRTFLQLGVALGIGGLDGRR